MAAKTDAQMVRQLREALAWLRGKPEQDRQILLPLLYTVDPKLAGLLRQVERFRRLRSPTAKQRRKAGDLMEKIAYVVFRSLRGVSSIKSYTSAGPQHDLVVLGNDAEWMCLCEYVRANTKRRGIVVEVKGTEDKVNDAQFARLCSVAHTNFRTTASLGVFFTLSGATGFPERARPAKRQIHAARLRQVLFNAAYRIPIVVFDWEDIRSLTNRDSLPVLLERKIRDIEELSGRAITPVQVKEVVLPDHLRAV